jgi:deazaflavin-dependent oxidoreductase (nitroreductase family)
MPLPRSVARFNRRVTNRVLGPLAPHLPGFGVVIHRGRRSGRSYRTPVNVFGRPGGVVVALTYGPSADWVRNVLAHDGCTLETRGRRLRLRSPRLIHDEGALSVPPMLRPVGRIGHVVDFLDLSLASPPRPMVPWWVGAFNVGARRALAAGMPMGPNVLLSVPGRKSGVLPTTPVSIVDGSDRCWVIGVFGDVDWVRNLRAAGQARIHRADEHRQSPRVSSRPLRRSTSSETRSRRSCGATAESARGSCATSTRSTSIIRKRPRMADRCSSCVRAPRRSGSALPTRNDCLATYRIACCEVMLVL